MRNYYCLIILLLALHNIGNGQNAFYRARKIISWRDSIFIINDQSQIQSTEAANKKRLFLDSINSVVFYYAGQGSWDKFQQYPAMKRLYDTLFQLTTNIEDLRILVKSSTRGIGDSIRNTIETIDHKRAALTRATDSLGIVEVKKNELLNSMRADEADTTWRSDSLKTAGTLTALKNNISALQAAIDSLSLQLREYTLRPSFKGLGTLEQRRLISNYAEGKVDISGLGFSNSVRIGVEAATQNALYENREALPPLKNFSFPSQVEIIDALAIYLAKRVKQEMVLAFTDQLKKSLKTDSLLSTFFPETRKLFLSLADDQFARFGTAWRYAISKDFVQLPDNFMLYHKTKSWLGEDVYPFFNDAYQMSVLIRKKYNFIELIEELNTRSLDGSSRDTLRTKALRQFVQITNVINKELFNREANGLYWIDGEIWSNLSRDEFDIFWALANERYPKLTNLLTFKNGESKYELGDVSYFALKNWIKRILFALNKFQRDQKELYDQMKPVGGPTENPWEFRIATYWDNVEDIIRMVIDNQLVNQQFKSTIGKSMQIIDGFFNIYESIQRKNYVSAVDETLGLIQQFVKNPQALNPKQWQMLLDSNLVRIQNENLYTYLDKYYPNLTLNQEQIKPSSFLRLAIYYPDSLAAATPKTAEMFNRYLEEIGQQNELLQGFTFIDNTLMLTADNLLYNQLFKNNLVANLSTARRAASIFQDIILADGSKELSLVIEKYAMPVGSYKIKRRSRWSVDLNAYFGGYVGYEWVQSPTDNTYKGSPGLVVGLTAPVGFSYSWAGFTKNPIKSEGYSLNASKGIRRFKGTSHSISLTIIDIAAVVSYRFTNTADKPLPANVTWGQLIAPGLFYRYGIRNTPLCLNVGVQFAPQLRTIEDVENQNTIRATIGAAMDLPLLNLGKGK